MSEESNPSQVQFKIFADDSRPGHIDICMKHGTAHIDFDWDDTPEGNADMTKIMLAYPAIVMRARQEFAIKKEVDGLDQDLLDLLGEDEA